MNAEIEQLKRIKEYTKLKNKKKQILLNTNQIQIKLQPQIN